MEVKKFLTFEEQLHCIENKGFIISDKDKCLKFLEKVNYYKISAYFTLFKDKTGKFIVRPKLNLSINKNPYLFEQLIVLKNLYTNAMAWNNNFLISLESLLEEYSKYIRFMDIGFPDNWKETLSK